MRRLALERLSAIRRMQLSEGRVGGYLALTAAGHCLPVLPAGDVKPQNVLLDGNDWNVLVRPGGSAFPTCAALRGKPSLLRAVPANLLPTRRCLRPSSSPVRPLPVLVCMARCPSALLQLTDFGIARSLSSGRTLTSKIGTAQFMPPEALSGACACMRACVRYSFV